MSLFLNPAQWLSIVLITRDEYTGALTKIGLQKLLLVPNTLGGADFRGIKIL